MLGLSSNSRDPLTPLSTNILTRTPLSFRQRMDQCERFLEDVRTPSELRKEDEKDNEKDNVKDTEKDIEKDNADSQGCVPIVEAVSSINEADQAKESSSDISGGVENNVIQVFSVYLIFPSGPTAVD